MAIRRTMLMGQKTGGLLPSEFQQVEFLGVNGTQYLATDYVPQKDDEISTQTWVNSGYSNNRVFLSAGNGTYQLIILINGSGSNVIFNCRYFSSGSAIRIEGLVEEEWISVNVTKDGTFTINDRSNQINYGNALDGNSNKLWIFKRVNGQYPFYGRIKGFTITRDGETKLNLIPCVRKADSKPGMYDTVSQTFYTNAGTGEFIVPN